MMELTDVLRGGRQCDEDGVEIIMSREACCVAADTIDCLRAEVASLKEERATLELRLADLSAAHASLTQQLAAANGRVEKYRDVMVEIKQHAEFKADRNADCDYVELSGIQGGQLLCVLDLVNAALSDLPEADKEKS